MREDPSPEETDFEQWLVARQGWLYRTAYLLTGDRFAAEDLTQNTLAKLYLAWHRIDDHEHVDGYARKVLLNEHRSAWRRPWRRREVTREHLPEQEDQAAGYDDTDDALWRFVGTLPARQRAVVVLRYYEQLTEAETAQVLGISVGTVKSQCSRALARLRSDVKDHPEFEGRQGR